MFDPSVAPSVALLAQLKSGAIASKGTDWSDPNAARQTYEGELHHFRTELEAFRGGTGAAPKLQFEPAAALLGRTFPPTPWLVRGILPEDSVYVLAGEPKSHKTFAAIDLCVAMATATPALGEFQPGKSEPRAVAIFAAEDSPRSMRARLSALALGRGLDPAKALERIYIQCRGGLDIGTDQGLCALGAALRMLPENPALVVIDPLRDVHRAEENDSGEMSIVMGNLRALRTIIGCSVLLIHHMAKSTRDTNGRRVGQRMRGSSAVHGAIDGGLYVSPKDSTGGTIFTNACEVELKAAKGAGRFVLTLALRDDVNGEVEHAKWTYEHEEIVVPNDGVAHLILVMQTEWQHSGGRTPRPMSKTEIRARLQKNTAAVENAIRVAEEKGAIRQVHQGKKSLGYVFRPESLEPDASTDQLSSPQTEPNPCLQS